MREVLILSFHLLQEHNKLVSPKCPNYSFIFPSENVTCKLLFLSRVKKDVTWKYSNTWKSLFHLWIEYFHKWLVLFHIRNEKFHEKFTFSFVNLSFQVETFSPLEIKVYMHDVCTVAERSQLQLKTHVQTKHWKIKKTSSSI